MGFYRYTLTLVLIAMLLHEGLSILKEEAKPAALLKPSTSIAGTNLFLNTVYKWHDRTMPGCFVTLLQNSVDLMMVCNNDDQKWYDSPKSDWILEQTNVSLAHAALDVYAFKNVGAGENVIGRGTNENIWMSVDDSPTYNFFFFEGDLSNKNHLQIMIKGFNYNESLYVDQQPTSNHRSKLFIRKDYIKPTGYRYSFVPAIKMEARMYNFEFIRPLDEELARHTSQKGLIDSYTINNDSPTTLSRKVTVSEKVTNEFSWGLSESFTYGTTVTAKAGIPFLAETEIETGFELEIASSQDWTNSVEKSFEMSYEVNVPPRTQVEISAYYDLIKDMRMDYTATTEIKGKTSRVSVFDDIVSDTPASGEMIRNHLESTKFDGEIIEVKENTVIARYNGTMVASVGVRGRLSVNGDTVRTNS